mgnify:CR=1 FL=1
MERKYLSAHKNKQTGFTLVEIAIVLVIIGLILGGVLKGQVLIDNSKYKNFTKQIESYRGAFYTFQDTYQALPGDILNIEALDPNAEPGNGNGVINGNRCTTTDEESCTVWSHLRYAGIIAGSPDDTDATASPTHTYGGLVDTIATATWGNGVSENKILAEGIPGDVAQRYDNEYDDGDATSGSVSRNGGSGTTYDLSTTHDLVIAI